MRIEICIALLASTAVHAGLMVVAPASVATRDSAQVSAAPRAITARLKNTLASATPARPARLNSARTGRSAAAHPPVTGRAVRTTNAMRQQPRIDNPLRFYPPEAVARGLEGETILMLRYGSDGALINAEIAKSSGHAILDEAALRAIRATPRLAAGPREMLFPVSFALH
jgi:protein TonB